jgi:hypothetical protein
MVAETGKEIREGDLLFNLSCFFSEWVHRRNCWYLFIGKILCRLNDQSRSRS